MSEGFRLWPLMALARFISNGRGNFPFQDISALVVMTIGVMLRNPATTEASREEPTHRIELHHQNVIPSYVVMLFPRYSTVPQRI